MRTRGGTFQTCVKVLGYVLPLAAMVASMAAGALTYDIGKLCYPRGRVGLATWFVWIVVLALSGGLVQAAIFSYYFLVLAKGRHGDAPPSTDMTFGASSDDDSTLCPSEGLRETCLKHWRGMAWTLILIASTVYFTVIFVQNAIMSPSSITQRGITPNVKAWLQCLTVTDDACPKHPNGIGVGESQMTATLMLASVGVSPTNCRMRVH